MSARPTSGIQQAVARLLGPVDAARAVYRGLVLIGHRRSVQAGEMFWALPGRRFAHGPSLKLSDSAFQVLTAPPAGWLVQQQPILKELLETQRG